MLSKPHEICLRSDNGKVRYAMCAGLSEFMPRLSGLHLAPLPRANRVIILFTPVRIVADRVGSTYVLRYQRIASHAFRACFASAPHTCSLNCDSPDTASSLRIEASIMASATPAAYVRGQSTSILQEQGVQGLRWSSCVAASGRCGDRGRLSLAHLSPLVPRPLSGMGRLREI